MVVAEMSGEPDRRELVTLDGGYVMIRRLSFGEKLHRSAMNQLAVAMDSRNPESVEATMALANEKATLYDFAKCIVDHNLERKDGRPYDFKNPEQVKTLDPRIGEEISTYLDAINNFEGTDAVKNSQGSSEPAS
jgi:hypothetical protein